MSNELTEQGKNMEPSGTINATPNHQDATEILDLASLETAPAATQQPVVTPATLDQLKEERAAIAQRRQILQEKQKAQPQTSIQPTQASNQPKTKTARPSRVVIQDVPDERHPNFLLRRKVDLPYVYGQLLVFERLRHQEPPKVVSFFFPDQESEARTAPPDFMRFDVPEELNYNRRFVKAVIVEIRKNVQDGSVWFRQRVVEGGNKFDENWQDLKAVRLNMFMDRHCRAVLSAFTGIIYKTKRERRFAANRIGLTNAFDHLSPEDEAKLIDAVTKGDKKLVRQSNRRMNAAAASGRRQGKHS